MAYRYPYFKGRLHGDMEGARGMIRRAEQLMSLLENQMKFQKLFQGRMYRELPGGTTVDIRITGTQRVIDIYHPPQPGRRPEEDPKAWPCPLFCNCCFTSVRIAKVGGTVRDAEGAVIETESYPYGDRRLRYDIDVCFWDQEAEGIAPVFSFYRVENVRPSDFTPYHVNDCAIGMFVGSDPRHVECAKCINCAETPSEPEDIFAEWSGCQEVKSGEISFDMVILPITSQIENPEERLLDWIYIPEGEMYKYCIIEAEVSWVNFPPSAVSSPSRLSGGSCNILPYEYAATSMETIPIHYCANNLRLPRGGFGFRKNDTVMVLYNKEIPSESIIVGHTEEFLPTWTLEGKAYSRLIDAYMFLVLEGKEEGVTSYYFFELGGNQLPAWLPPSDSTVDFMEGGFAPRSVGAFSQFKVSNIIKTWHSIQRGSSGATSTGHNISHRVAENHQGLVVYGPYSFYNSYAGIDPSTACYCCDPDVVPGDENHYDYFEESFAIGDDTRNPVSAWVQNLSANISGKRCSFNTPYVGYIQSSDNTASYSVLIDIRHTPGTPSTNMNTETFPIPDIFIYGGECMSFPTMSGDGYSCQATEHYDYEGSGGAEDDAEDTWTVSVTGSFSTNGLMLYRDTELLSHQETLSYYYNNLTSKDSGDATLLAGGVGVGADVEDSLVAKGYRASFSKIKVFYRDLMVYSGDDNYLMIPYVGVDPSIDAYDKLSFGTITNHLELQFEFVLVPSDTSDPFSVAETTYPDWADAVATSISGVCASLYAPVNQDYRDNLVSGSTIAPRLEPDAYINSYGSEPTVKLSLV